jgi:SAM-dependent methyltransferase
MKCLFDSGPDMIFRGFLSSVANDKCLVLGSGSEVELVSEFCDDIVGVNVSLEALRRIKRFDVDLILADAQSLPIKDSCVGTVVCRSTLHHLKDLNQSVLEIKRVTANGSNVFLYEPGLLNFIAFLGRTLFPTNIHESSEKPFIQANLRNVVAKQFEVVNETDFFVFVHAIPILEKALNSAVHPRLLKWFSTFDALLCRTFLRNLSWIMVFTLRKK